MAGIGDVGHTKLEAHKSQIKITSTGMEQLRFFVLAAVFLISTIGYGALLCRWCFSGQRIDAAFAAAVGIAILVFGGGVLNALGLAFGTSLDALLSVGLVLFVAQAARTLARANQRACLVLQPRDSALEPGLWLAGGVFVFSATWVVPTTAFNPHDDLAQYLFRPYHMLHFGSVGANWFDSTGADSFGAQSWMQAFFLNHLPANYADAFDRVICFSLSCALVVSLGRALGITRIYRLVAVVVLVFINPSHVNISATYSLSLSVLGLTLSVLFFARSYFVRRVETWLWARALIPSVLFVAALPALKFTSLIFIAVLCLLFISASAITFRTWRDVGIAVLVVFISGIIALGPWVLVFVPNYIASLAASPPDHKLMLTSAQIFRYWWQVHWEHFLQLDPVQYGQRGLVSTIGVLAIIVAPIVLVRFRAGRKSTEAEVFTFALIGSSAALPYLIGPALVPWGHLRYWAPFLISALPAAVLFLLSTTSAPYTNMPGESTLAKRGLAGLVLASCAIVIGLTFGDLVGRLRLALTSQTALLLASDTDLHSNVTNLLSPGYRQKIRAVQSKIPPGKKILAAIITPTHLDLERNPSDAMFIAALSSPWWGELAGMRPEEMRALLHERGIEYVIWQRTGDWVTLPETAAESVDHPLAVFGRQSRNYLAIYRAFDTLTMGPLVHASDEFLAFKVDPSYAGQASLHSYRLGTTIDFAAGGDFNYGVYGWSFREKPGMWSIDKTTQFLFQLEEPPNLDLTLVARFTAFVAPEHPKTTVDVDVNGKLVGRWAMTTMEPTTQCVRIPREIAGDGELTVTFRIDAPPPPSQLGINSDTRNLGILLKEVTITASDGTSSTCSP